MEALQQAAEPFRAFMVANLRPDRPAAVPGYRPPAAAGDAVQAAMARPDPRLHGRRAAARVRNGFLLFLPFLVIDLVVASVLMCLGMMMLPPNVVSLPFKLIFFVLVDGWRLVAGSLVQSFH